ncbi:MAG: acylneuraminate cytidylyltransferase family protein [Candidatus Pacearchaeota archaeon]
MKVGIIVPIKTNNKRLPGKTFKFLGGKPLYKYLFDTLNNLKNFDIDIYIDSSDERVLEIAKKYEFRIFIRPEEYNKDNITGDELIARNISNLESYDIIGLLHITSPFLTIKTIKKAISIISENSQIDSLFGVVPRYGRFWFENRPVNHDPQKLVATQFLTPVYEEATDMYFFRKDSFKKYGKRICGNFMAFEVNEIESVDIDTLEDLVYAESLIKLGLVKMD